MKSLTGMFPSTRGWALLLILLLGAGLLVAGCGEEEVPAPTTPTPPPAPPPAPEPEPEPEPPATPTGLMVSGSTTSSITWTWNAVEGAIGYVVQANMDEMWDDTDTVMFNGVPFTTMTTYTASDLEAGTTVYVRVAAAAGTAAAPLVSDFSTHVTGMAMAAALSAPANLEVKERGSDFIEWEWDAVDGADGYQSEFSIDAAFSAPDAAFHAADQRTRRASNLDPNSDGYLRVRALVGTLSEATFGTWSAASMGSTGAPPPPSTGLALDAPENVRATSPTETSITVDWDAVEEADNYFVQQSESGGDWVGASCGANGDSLVTDTFCIASGLSSVTDYRFRVRATQDGDRADSDWSAATATLRTGGIAPPPPVMGGDDSLNVEWTSTVSADGATHTITWNWDPVLDRADRQRIDHVVWLTTEESCGTLAGISGATASPDLDTVTFDAATNQWHNLKANISASIDGPGGTALVAGQSRTLCVVRTWEDELEGGLKVRRYGTMEAARASTVPAPAAAATAVTNHATTRRTTRLDWSYVMDQGFDYPGQIVAVNRNGSAPMDCDDGRSVASKSRVTTDDVSVTHSQTNPDAYSFYRFCVRAQNDDGHSDWVTVGANLLTRPAEPNRPTYVAADSVVTEETWGGQVVTKIVWSVSEKMTTPRRGRRARGQGISLHATHDPDCECPDGL